MSQELASRSLGSLCLGIVDVTGDVRGDRHVSQHYCSVGVDVAFGCVSSVCYYGRNYYVNAEADARKRA